MKRLTLCLICSIVMLYGYSQFDLNTTLYGSGFIFPVNIANAGDDRLFVVEQEGVIKILNADGSTEATPYLDINDRVINLFGIGDERGLLGLAFHPDYASNGYFYVNYIDNSGDTVISRFTVDGADPNIADPDTEFVILTFAQPLSNHNGGHLAFGPAPDHYLFISSGDGGDQNDPNDFGQRLDTFLGKILRIDVDGGSPYAVPSDNPFASDGNPLTYDEIWAYGLRNPWKFSFDRLTNDLWIGDVGQNENEEINKADINDDGLNYGWRCYEANSIFNSTGCPPDNTLTFPVGDYNHFTDGLFKCSVTGGFRYRGSEYSEFDGIYFFADYCSGEIGYLEYNGSSWDMTLNSVNGGNWTAFGEDINGELYVTDLIAGNIYKLIDENLSVAEFDESSFKMYPNPTQDMVTLDFNDIIPTEINIFDVQGKHIANLQEIDDSLFHYSVDHLTQGLYIVQVLIDDSQRLYKKLIVN